MAKTVNLSSYAADRTNRQSDRHFGQSVGQTVATLSRLGINSALRFALSESRQISKLELTSLNALVSYAADQMGESENSITERVTEHFSVRDMAQLPSGQFEDVVRYLVDTIDSQKKA